MIWLQEMWDNEQIIYLRIEWRLEEQPDTN